LTNIENLSPESVSVKPIPGYKFPEISIPFSLGAELIIRVAAGAPLPEPIDIVELTWAFPTTWRFAEGEVVPIPTFELASIVIANPPGPYVSRLFLLPSLLINL
jgi:hypothetical protein